MKKRKKFILVALWFFVVLSLSGCTKSTSAKYEDAKEYITAGEYDKAIVAFTEIDGYEDSGKYLMYVKAIQMMKNGQYDLAIGTLETLGNFGDSKILSIYYQAQLYEINQEYEQAEALYRSIATFRDSTGRIAAIPDLILDRDFASAKTCIETTGNYYNVLELVSKVYSTDANKMKRQIYDVAQTQLENECFNSAYAIFQTLADVEFSDSDMRVKDTIFAYAKSQMKQGNYQGALNYLIDLTDYSVADEQIKECRYQLALKSERVGQYAEAYATYVDLGDYNDCADRAAQFENDYAMAKALLEAGEYDSAKAAFKALNDYSDAQTMVKEVDYQKALALQTKGEYEKAISIFKALENYRDAKYQLAMSLYAFGDYGGAYSIFITIKGYKDVDNFLLTDDNLQAVRDKMFSIGKYVEFGLWPQTKDGTDKAPIEWLVLDRDGNKALLISRFGLDQQQYNNRCADITWEECTLRKWLNETFMTNAFTREEENGIVLTEIDNTESQCYSGWSTSGGNNTQDKIFLLSYAEANKYFDVEYNNYDIYDAKSRIEPTAYAKAQGAFSSGSYKTAEGKTAGSWWLRSPGFYQTSAAFVASRGDLWFHTVYEDRVRKICPYVRPALWVALDCGIF